MSNAIAVMKAGIEENAATISHAKSQIERYERLLVAHRDDLANLEKDKLSLEAALAMLEGGAA